MATGGLGSPTITSAMSSLNLDSQTTTTQMVVAKEKEPINIESFTNNNRLSNEFDIDKEGCCLGAGSFGVVIKGCHKIDDKPYAIKLIYIVGEPKEMDNDESDADTKDRLREEFNKRILEIKMWAKVSNNVCVQYRSAWVETNRECRDQLIKYAVNSGVIISEYLNQLSNRQHFAILHIQMDWCWFPLRHVIQQMLKYFEIIGDKQQNRRQLLPPIGYYIAGQLLAEMLEALHSLHSSLTPIIHRDIKPDNILIRYDLDGRFIRIADFGLAVEHRQKSQSHTQRVGADKYMAPEVRNSRNYNTKADVYSMGVVIQELFNFNINTIDKIQSEYKEYYKNLTDITSKCLSGLNTIRPTCKDILNDQQKWIKSYDNIEPFIQETIKTNNQPFDPLNGQFIEFFLQTKYNLNKKCQ